MISVVFPWVSKSCVATNGLKFACILIKSGSKILLFTISINFVHTYRRWNIYIRLSLSRIVQCPFFFTSASAPKFQRHLHEKWKKNVVIVRALSSFVYVMRVGDISTYMHEIDRKKNHLLKIYVSRWMTVLAFSPLKKKTKQNKTKLKAKYRKWLAKQLHSQRYFSNPE